MKIETWSEAYAREVETWRYGPPYDAYDAAADPDDAAEMRDASNRDHYRAVLTGRGLGEGFVRAELEYAREQWAPARFRLFVTAWNVRAIRLYERLGFSEVGRETRSFPLQGEHEFLRMERPA